MRERGYESGAACALSDQRGLLMAQHWIEERHQRGIASSASDRPSEIPKKWDISGCITATRKLAACSSFTHSCLYVL